MSPAMAQAGAGSAAKDVKRESATARLLGSGMCHPFCVQVLDCTQYLTFVLRNRRNCGADGLPPCTITSYPLEYLRTDCALSAGEM